jgi:hypothetical protein
VFIVAGPAIGFTLSQVVSLFSFLIFFRNKFELLLAYSRLRILCDDSARKELEDIVLDKMRHFIPLVAMSSLILFIIFTDSSRYLAQQFSAAGQVYFDFDGNSSEVSYQTYENMAAGIRVKYPSNWNMLENLGNVSGNNIIADFYNTGINATRSYSENANVVILNQSEYLKNIMKKSLDTSVDSLAIQPTRPIASAADASKSTKFLIDETLNSTIGHLTQTFGNVTLLQSIPTVISGLPGYQITYLITDNQTDTKQTQAWTFKDNKWYVVTYSSQPSAYYSSVTAINIINSIVLR